MIYFKRLLSFSVGDNGGKNQGHVAAVTREYDISDFEFYCFFFFLRSGSGSPAPPRGHRAAETRVHGPLHPGSVHHQETWLL